jgi:8-oxo-dGTP diphosphatase
MAALSLNTRQVIARWLKQASWMSDGMRFVLQLTQPRFTAGVVGVVLNVKGEVLLVEHVFHPRTPWGLPGGWMERGESPARALCRELQEETGVQVTVSHPLLIDTGYYYRTHLDIAYLCHAQNDVRELSSELLDYRWASLDDLPSLLPFHQAAALAAREHHIKEG